MGNFKHFSGEAIANVKHLHGEMSTKQPPQNKESQPLPANG
jgi:hypothetical protein